MDSSKEVLPQTSHKQDLYGGIVWIVAALTLFLYGLLFSLRAKVPGVEELVDFISSVDGIYIYLAAFISIFIEGLYVIGSFFPGATLVTILAILSQKLSFVTFLLTITVIYIGWCIAGGINILSARYFNSWRKATLNEGYAVTDNVFTTWFPAFRANHEVAQIVEGGNPLKVLFSAIRVRLYASIFAGLITYVSALLIDLENISNEEGLISLLIVAVIMLTVGIVKIRNYYLKQSSTN
ncbi:MAG TPA: hypothetical protein VJH21_01735 [Candidatus Paceibacterota bacterium]